jgi:hypothetical protein
VSNVFYSLPHVQNHLSFLRGDQPQSSGCGAVLIRALMFSSDEKPILILGNVNRSRTLFAIISDVVDTSVHWVKTHVLGAEGLQ